MIKDKETYECSDCGASFTLISDVTPEYCIMCASQGIFIVEEFESDEDEYDT